MLLMTRLKMATIVAISAYMAIHSLSTGIASAWGFG